MNYLLILLGGLETADAMITHLLVGGGLAQEGNPLVLALVREGSFPLLKIIGVLLSLLILWRLYRYIPQVTLLVTISIVIFYFAVLAWNLGTFFAV